MDQRNQDIQAPSLPNRLATEEEYGKYCQELTLYYYELEDTTITMQNYTDYVKSYKKKHNYRDYVKPLKKRR